VSFARWLAATLLIQYGFAKLNGSQFTVLDSELSKPLGQVSGFWLTWYYFGYSKVYGNLIALMQIGGAILLVLPRTSLFGALLLLPIVFNIILIDILFGVEPGATIVAVVILTCLLAIVLPHVRKLWNAVRLEGRQKRSSSLIQYAALGVILVGGWTFTWWIANYNNRLPTPIDGAWSVVSEGDSQRPWTNVFFERNRAFMAVFRSSDGRYDQRHFEIDSNGLIQVWETWLSKGDLLMQGRILADGQIELVAEPSAGRILLRRRN